MTDETPGPAPANRPAPLVLAIVFGAVGLFFWMVGLRLIQLGEVYAPHWVIVLCGTVFLGTSGLMFASRARFADQRLVRIGQAAAALVVIACFAMISSWIAWGEGERVFESSVSVGAAGLSVTTAEPADEQAGRFVFGLAAAACWVGVVVAGWTTLAAIRDAARRQ